VSADDSAATAVLASDAMSNVFILSLLG